ncbi:TIM barrel protein [Candidatus Poribacteria bacterium]|jgi:hydroxypyruvate isomerase|nr:TIM barrel protein [Candidatus Poribacteria bacterium]MBT5537214.1 TIM barrel protein [Candidatus Poribacteria bacterium]MBT5710314.1 TIM barrel protein [Candidatus Poribacteria bacterium]MBT7098942.1 TIM barrel protein [Candidatus Poribacteria bacterium]MBT7808373.1 TIM barrel protein [Candidatus Poribacteria bacterium]
MGRIKQSYCYPLYQSGQSLEELIASSAEIGYAAIELWGRSGAPFDDICELAEKHGIVVASMCGHDSLPSGLNTRDNHGRIQEELHESIDIAADRGIPGLICFSGNRNGLSDEEGIEICAEGLDLVKGYAEEKGINLNVELLNSKVDHPDYQCDRTPWGVELCKAVGSPRVKLLYDIYHMQIMEGDLIRTIQESHEHIGHYHTAGNPGRNDMDETQEIYYPPVMQAIADTGYDLYVGHEFSPKGDKLEALKAAFETCDV